MKARKTLTWATALIIVPSLGFFGANAKADILAGASGGVVTSVDLSVVGGTSASSTIGQLDEISPPPYDEDLTAIDLTASHTSALIDLFAQSGTGEISAFSDVDGLPGARTVNAVVTIEDFSFEALTVAPGLPLAEPLITLDIGGDNAVINSFVSITGSSEFNLTIAGDSTLLGLSLTVDGDPLDLSALVDGDGKAAPNTVILPGVTGLAGLTITLNEQIELGDGITSFGRQVSAVHLNFDDVDVGGGLGLINGDVYIAQTYALVTVPEPSTGLILALTGLFFGFARRKRR
ncbi:MAG TPA: PEP-CTERM sorting domain-containing protein [Verrucomicrobiales bacterium]|nr:PEP-CTERM sorting domain-containing protein [Verrucomicrobiales bacterium]